MSQELMIKDTGVLARAELDVQISTAKTYPRDVKKSMEYAMQLATLDEDTAQSCFYVLPRKDKDGVRKEIKGASIRLAEIMANAWGNIHAATRIVENDGIHITAEGVAWDLETNLKMIVPQKTGIQFKDKSGKYYTANADMQTMLSNAAAAKALRNAIFKVVPRSLVDRILEKAITFSIGDQKTINSKVSEVFDKLLKMGLEKQKILDYYNRKTISDITPDDLRSLIGLGTAIKEGMIKIEDVFSSEKEKIQSSVAADKINSLLSNKTQDSQILTEYEKIKKQLLSAKSMETLDIAADLIQSVEEENRAALVEIYHSRKSDFKELN